MLKYSLGLDISSKKFDACMSVIDMQQTVKVKATSSFTNDILGFKKLNVWIAKHYKAHEVPLTICMEATGVYYECCALFLYQKDYKVAVILPNKAKKYLQSLGLKSKNDTIDAKGLAQMGAEQKLKLWEPLGDFYYTLRAMTRQHQSLQETKTGLKNQLHALTFGMYRIPLVEKQLEKTIKLINKQLEEIDKSIQLHIQSNELVNSKVQNILRIKGIGCNTVATIIGETNGFILFENAKQLVSYAGYDVVENQSGKHIGKTKISKKGNSRIRRALFMPAFSVVTYKQNPFLNLYERTLAKHNIKMKSYVAVQKKLLTTIYALWKNEVEYDENYNQKVIFLEKKQEESSVLSFEKTLKENSPTQGRTIQGIHSLNDRSMSPLC
jgi:transposase